MKARLALASVLTFLVAAVLPTAAGAGMHDGHTKPLKQPLGMHDGH